LSCCAVQQSNGRKRPLTFISKELNQFFTLKLFKMKKAFSFAKLGIYVLLAFVFSMACGSVLGAVFEVPQHAPAIGKSLFAIQMGATVLSFYLGWNNSPAVTLKAVFLEGLCEKIQDSLINIHKDKAPQVQRTQVGYLQMLMSAENTAGVEQIPIPSDGKDRTVRIKGIRRGIASDITDEDDGDCATEIEKAPFEFQFHVNRFLRT
jgi:hypothetical protein